MTTITTALISLHSFTWQTDVDGHYKGIIRHL
jgi:hypothetical protein